METLDIHVRVLFDFEYTTKDGKNVKIKEGEKLYLIKKTNEDWWQVIRNSGRPFYVPASYIEEIPRTNAYSRNEKKFNEGIYKLKNQITDDTYRIRSCSVDSEQMQTDNKIKPIIPKRTIFHTNRICSSQDFESPQSLTNEECIQNDEEADYVNIQQNIEHDTKGSFNSLFQNDKVSLSTASNVDRLLENISNNLISAEEKITNGYSHVTIRPCSRSPVNNDLQINLSHSLEELTQEIELKAKSIGGVKCNTGYSKIDFVKCLSKDMIVPAKNISESCCSDLKQVNTLQKCNDSEINKNKLQYSGSFKTKHEREKWAKNYVLLSSMREEECSPDSDKDKIEEQLLNEGGNDDNNNVNVDKSNDHFTDNCNIVVDSSSDVSKSDNSDIVKSDKNVNDETKIFSNEQVNFLISSSGISEKNNKFMHKEYFDSSIEDLDKNSVFVNLLLTPSDKGSTDSLLDVDNHLSIQDGSICTTASDSLLHTSDTSEECLSSILRDASIEENPKRKKQALKRNSRVECHRIRFPVRGISPPIPDENQQPSRELFGGWSEYRFTDGRIFFYNSRTGEKSWKPPRRRCNTADRENKHNESTSNLYSGSSSPLAEVDTNSGENLNQKENSGVLVPTGWRLETDAENSCQCFINVATGAKWFSSNDDEGRVYYFEENSSESSWTLPAMISTSFHEKEDERKKSLPDNHIYSNLPIITRNNITPNKNSITVPDNNRNRSVKSKSMIFMEKSEELPGPFSSKNWPQLLDGQMSILKEGTLNRTKITENGKRLRKNWSSSHVVLTELLLLFYKDAKSFVAGISGPGRPEISVDLNGAVIEKGDKASSRKNVYIISTVLCTQVLIQDDCTQEAHSWHVAIQSVINNLPSRYESCRRPPRGFVGEDVSLENESKKFYKVTRSKSIKAKSKEGSIEDLAVSPAERQTKIKARLKKFFNRRPTMESLVKKGIWKDEPAFGCYLDKVAGNESPRIPLFVRRCINCIEKNEENMKTDGLYRASGNLSQVQKIRLQVDQNNLSVIEEEEDVHVLTGALKLFFRELKEPLIPYHLFHKAIKASHNHNKKEKISQFREITKALPTANYDTLKFLLQHLLRITKYKEYNRMHIPNIAIVFGPTLMWPEQESNNMALDLMQQNLVIECLLVDYDNIFK